MLKTHRYRHVLNVGHFWPIPYCARDKYPLTGAHPHPPSCQASGSNKEAQGPNRRPHYLGVGDAVTTEVNLTCEAYIICLPCWINLFVHLLHYFMYGKGSRSQMERNEERKRKTEEKEQKMKRLKRKATSKASVARSVRLADIKYTCPTCGNFALFNLFNLWNNVKVLCIC